MNDILDFIRSAAPWVAMGLAVAILAVRGAVKIKKGEKQDSNYRLEGSGIQPEIRAPVADRTAGNAGGAGAA